ncbi:hypothetical protein DFJ77DRAFT_458144 [Powellomyces hirtus]|nr:hypothetical protein DFJ77DRAFT_458144 [Powellomyces hirtus]
MPPRCSARELCRSLRLFANYSLRTKYLEPCLRVPLVGPRISRLCLKQQHLSTSVIAEQAATGTISIQSFGKHDGALWLRVMVPTTSIGDTTKPSEAYVFLASPSDTVADFLGHIKEEFPKYGPPELVVEHQPEGKGELVATSSLLSDPIPNSTKITDFIKSSTPGRIQFPRGFVLKVDTEAVKVTLAQMAVQRKALERELDELEKVRLDTDARARRWVTVVKWGGLVYVTGQLGAIMFLTQQLGWDLMEPVSYLITLGATIFSCLLYVIMRRDPAYTNMAGWMRNGLRGFIGRRRGFDKLRYAALKAQLAPPIQYK